MTNVRSKIRRSMMAIAVAAALGGGAAVAGEVFTHDADSYSGDNSSNYFLQSGGGVSYQNGTFGISPGGVSLWVGAATANIGSGATFLGDVYVGDDSHGNTVNGAILNAGVGAATRATLKRVFVQGNAEVHLDNVSLEATASSNLATAAFSLLGTSTGTSTANTLFTGRGQHDAVDLFDDALMRFEGSVIVADRAGVVSNNDSVVFAHNLQATGGMVALYVTDNSSAMVRGGTFIGTGATDPAIDRLGQINGAGIALLNDTNRVGQATSLTVDGATMVGQDAGLVSEAISGDINVDVSNSRISGGRGGVVFNQGSASGGGSAGLTTMTLTNSQIDSGSGAAIWVDAGARASIALRDGTTLRGANGVVLLTDALSQTDVTVANTTIAGDVVNQGGTTNIVLDQGAKWIGRMQAVNQLAVGLSGQWTLTGSSTLTDLNNRGWIDLNGAPGALHTLTVNSLAGDGVFGMSTDFSTSSSDKLVVTGANQANGNFALNIKGQGVDPKKSGSITVVETQGGSANFELAYGAADLGTYQYVLKQDGNNWVLVPTTKTTPFADSVLAITGVAPTIWYSQLIPLRTRLGELRFQQDNGGGWARAYGSKLNISSSAGTPYSQRQSGLAVGADKAFQTLDGKVFIGGVFNASRSDLDDHAGANGSVDAYSIGVYGAWLNQHGYYLSGLLNYNHYSSKAQAVGSGGSSAHGSFATNGVGFSVEGGRKFELNNGFFLEPYAQVAGLRMQSVDVTMSNGMMAHGDHTSSLQGALGATLGNTFRSIAGNVVEPYVRLAEVNEFAKGADISINGNTFHNNLSGSRTELGLGVAAQIGKSLSANVDYTYAKGGRLSQPFMLNAGLRYEW